MDQLTRAPRIIQGRSPAWRRQVRETFPWPSVSAWLLAAVVLGVILGADRLLGLGGPR